MIAAYVFFLAFVTSAVSGALVVFHATRSRFKYPELVKHPDQGRYVSSKSFLFFMEIVQVSPEGWVRSFLKRETQEGAKQKFKEDLGLAYLYNYITESYLVAAKVADKVRYLMPAQTVFSNSIRILLVWLIIAAATVIVVPEQSKNVGAPPPPPASASPDPSP